MSGPQTMREALIAELIGDLDTLITRTEELKAALPAAADKAADKVAGSADAMLGKIEQSASQLRADLARDAGIIAQTVQKAAGDAQAAAAVVDKAGRRFALLALVTGLCGGLLGGLLVGLASAVNIFG